MTIPEDTEARAGACWACDAGIDTSAAETVAVIHSRKEEDGGPFRSLLCDACGARNGLLGDAETGWLLHPVEGDYESAVVDWVAPRLGLPRLAAARAWWKRNRDRVERFRRQSSPRRERPAAAPAATTKAPPLNGPRAVLGVGPHATRDEIRSAYRAAVKKCHPDRVANLDEEIQALANRKAKELRDAYEALLAETSD